MKVSRALVLLVISAACGVPEEKYKAAVIRSAEQCAVKKHLEHPPMFNITTSTVEAVAA